VKPLGPAVLLTARPRARLFHLVFGSHIGRALGADSGEKSGLASDIDTATVESLIALDPQRPIREAVSFNDPQQTCDPPMVTESVLKQRPFRFSRR